MPVKGSKQVSNRFKSEIKEIAGIKSEKVMNQILITGASNAARITPIDTSNLINSQYRKVERTSLFGLRGTVGYTAFYSGFVHNAKGKLKGKPRKGKGKSGSYWSPKGEPHFLTKGFERDGLEAIKRIIKEGYSV